MANSGEVMAAAGVVRRSDTTVAMMLLAAVCELALRFVCTPTGSKPRTAIKAKCRDAQGQDDFEQRECGSPRIVAAVYLSRRSGAKADDRRCV